MRKYLSTLHKKPDHHKRRFALGMAGLVTLIIFGFWTLVSFHTSQEVLTDNQKLGEPDPLSALWYGTASALKATFRLESSEPSLEQVETSR